MTVAQSLGGKVALVTGASREIGAAMAEALAARGAGVLVAHHREPLLAEETAARIRARGGTVVTHDCDCSQVGAVESMVARAVRDLGRLDICVANAGVTMWGRFLDYTETAWDTVVDLNLKGSFFTAQAAARQIVQQGTPGSIVFSSSIAGVSVIPQLAAYGVTKAGLRHLARCLAVELGPHRISVNALGIGPTVNARNLADDPDYDAHWGAVSPAGRAACPEDAARALVFLLENPYVTGETLMVDGGWTVQSPTPALDFLEGSRTGHGTPQSR
jgi:NAD(P)-dependent dehydrogenase (short-subunit alcohol dehydrogenase family)